MPIESKTLKTWAACCVCFCAAALFNASTKSASAEEFRVVSKVFSGKDDTATSESTTLFADGPGVRLPVVTE